ncbi:cysteine-rich PDZ-binding protein-like [Sycon ciliatum]|uniref:cysteine-rich PDZ-binding protein-like n=1 Tax=Sycon ciliatum TaxID=27933 RepID=UPI0020A91717
MVCSKCEKKLGTVACPDKWRDGARNVVRPKASGSASASAAASSSSGGPTRKLGENKLLSGRKTRFQPYAKFEKCKVCKQAVHQQGSHYCQGCSYKLGICAMCGKQMVDVKNYKQTSV